MALTKITADVIETGAITSDKLASGAVSASSLSSITTDNVSEGSTNTYFTNARARGSVSVTGGGLSYDSGTGVIQIASIPNASLANSSLTVNSNSVSLGGTVTLDTDDIGEGSTNLYFTNARAQGAISGGTGVTVSSGTISIGQDVATSSTPTFGNITTTGYIAGPATFTIDPAAVGDNTGTVVIAGNLQVDGTTTTINSTTMTVDDLNITLASGAANAAAADGAGITVDGASATITYDGTNDDWNINKSLRVEQNGALLRRYVSSWSYPIHDIVHSSYHSNTGDYTYLKAAGNTSNSHGALVTADSVFAVGTTDVETGSLVNSATAPLTNTWLYANSSGLNVNGTITSTGNITSSGYVQSAGALKVTETGTAQVIMIGNQDSGGTNTPAMIMGVNGYLRFGRGSSWSGEGGTFTEALNLQNGNATFAGTISSGVHTITSSGTIGGATLSNAYLKITDNTNTMGFDVNEIHTTDNLYLLAEAGNIIFRDTGNAGVILKNGSTTFMDGSRNLTNIGTISSGAITTTGDLTIPNKIIHSGDTDTYLSFANADDFRIVVGNSTRAAFNTSKIHFNQEGINQDFQVEGQGTGNEGLLYVDASTNKVGIGTTNPSGDLTISNAGAEGIEFFAANGSNLNATQHYNRSGAVYVTNKVIAADHQFWSGATERMRIKSDGTVTITGSGSTNLLLSSYATVARLQSGAGAVFGHNVYAGTNANEILQSNTGYYGAFIKMYYNNGIQFHTISSAGTANDVIDSPSVTGTERMRITSTGQVGIGTTSPTAGTSLDVQGNYIRCRNVYMGTGSSGTKFEGGNGSYEPGTGNLLTGSYGLDLNFLVAVTGVGVVTSAKVDSPTGDFFTNDGSISSLSDERVKSDITTLSDGLDIVKQLRPVTFKYNDTSEDADGNKRLGASVDKVRYGFIAQEVEEVAPQYVETGIGYINNEEVDDFKSMSTTRMIPMLFKAIQEQQVLIEAQATTIADLTTRITTLEG